MKKDHKKEYKGSWQIFLIAMGFLCIMLSPYSADMKQNSDFVMIISGLILVLMGVIMLKKTAQRERREKKW